MLKRTTHINMLYDFYQNLLTEKQRSYMELYYHDDLSLSEAAEQFHVSRQAVFENIKRAEQALEQYESQLQLLSKYKERQHIIEELFTVLEKESESEANRKQLEQLINALKNVD